MGAGGRDPLEGDGKGMMESWARTSNTKLRCNSEIAFHDFRWKYTEVMPANFQLLPNLYEFPHGLVSSHNSSCIWST
jgi:hypothetical protein